MSQHLLEEIDILETYIFTIGPVNSKFAYLKKSV